MLSIVNSAVTLSDNTMSHYSCVSCPKRQGVTAPERSSSGFCVSGLRGTTVRRHHYSNRHMLVDGFWRNRIARGCQAKAGKRIRSEALFLDLNNCSDAVAPESIEAKLIRNRVGFALPLNRSPESI